MVWSVKLTCLLLRCPDDDENNEAFSMQTVWFLSELVRIPVSLFIPAEWAVKMVQSSKNTMQPYTALMTTALSNSYKALQYLNFNVV